MELESRPIIPGWLFEVDDDETAHPPGEPEPTLLAELDISLLDIARKTRWVLRAPWLSSSSSSADAATTAPPGADDGGRDDARPPLTASPDFWGPLAIVVCYACLLLAGHLKARKLLMRAGGAFL